MLEKLYKRSSFTVSDLPSFQRHETVFIILNLGMLAALLLMHFLSSSFLGRPSQALVLVLASIALAYVGELIWVRKLCRELQPGSLLLLTWSSITLNLLASGVLTLLANHEDSPYFTLAVVPVLLAAFRLSLPGVV